MRPRNRLAASLVVALVAHGAAGCHDSDDGFVEDVAIDTSIALPDVDLDAVVVYDTVPADTLDASPLPDVDPDAADDAADIAGDAAVVEPGEFGTPCIENSECLSGWCVESNQGPVCTRSCVDDCPTGWSCVGISGQLDVAFVCVPREDRLCQPCAIDSQCGSGYCLSFVDGDRCSAACGDDEDCPSGYRCELATSSSAVDSTSLQCIPVTNSCDCTTGNEGIQQPCNVANDAGTCWGLRTCLGGDGWSACDAPTPAEEVCDGLDNNCNLFVDEGLPTDTPCEATNAFGTCAGALVCAGDDGWLCTAGEAEAEVCDYDDDDCDGAIDEDFRDPETGLYTSDAHCGVCGNACEGFFPNAVSGCAVEGGVARCVVTSCLNGFYQAGPTTCLPVVAAACLPCTADANCVVPGNACLPLDGGAFCGQDCSAGNLNGFDEGVCPAGFTCAALDDGRQQCLPDTGSCSCLDADDDGETRPCSRANAFGTCAGLQECVPADGGWTACSAREPGAELCNGVDDDCNGVVDEGVVEPEEACANTNDAGTCTGEWRCTGPTGWQCTAEVPTAEVCDYLDNDCDGATDEGFADDDTGQYVADAHCGLCDRACDDVILFSSETRCELVDDLAACVALTCDEGFFVPPETNRVCIPTSGATDCSPCTEDSQCAGLPGGLCVDLDGTRSCTQACGEGDACPGGYDCVAGRCLPTSRSCTCLANNAGTLRPCANQNAFGTCTGTSQCDPDATPGWSDCSARVPGDEVCNGVDDDCDGLVDEAVTHSPATCSIENAFGTCGATYRCEGEDGWQCPVQVPVAEECNFRDDNCDGAVDEVFRDDAGRYVDDAHCGTCGVSCAGALPNATATCALNAGSPRCEVLACAEGYYQVGPLTCLPASDTTCAPCVTDANCPTPGDLCLDLDGGRFCGRDCAEGNVHGLTAGVCDDGFACVDVAGGARQCVPQSGSCSCLDDDRDALRTCSVQNALGTCFGTELCVPEDGWGGCTARVPAAEVCDGVDDDCDGQVDEGVAPPAEACEVTVEGVGTCAGAWSCQGAAGWVCPATTPVVEACDFADNDCDGQVDEDFRDEAGLYVDDAHCGSCGVSCAGAIPNATATCAAQDGGVARCVVAACAEGYYPASALTCLPAVDVTCQACTSDASCPTPGDRCVQLDDGRFCGRDCSVGNAHGEPAGVCAEGFTCAEVAGGPAQCVPVSGACGCTPEDAGVTRTCTRQSAAGTCFGVEECDPDEGFVGCTAREPSAEVCDGLDDDCDGQVDEGVVAPAEPCAVTVEGVGTCAATWSCQGAAGWVCPAATPAAETCNFADDDCDGQVDEDYRDDEGRYVDDAHCGTCGVSCDGALPNAEAGCAIAATGQPRCLVVACDPGYYQAGPTVCLAASNQACAPCNVDADCGAPGDRCLDLAGGPGGGRFCGQDCSPGNAHGIAAGTCPDEGFTCAAIAGGADQCVPVSGACDCSTSNAGASRTCSRVGAEGTCYGAETCDPLDGWVGCTARVPTDEVCNGVDDDCDGQVDEGVTAPAEACAVTVDGVGTCAAAWACQGAAGWVCPAATPAVEACNFVDDDCDGATDEVFKDGSGRYVDDAHCGTCGVSCAGAIPNATATCVASEAAVRCEVAACAAGYYQAGPLTCLPATDATCSPCASDANCPTPGDLCLVLDGGTFCGRDCAAGNVHGTDAGWCPAGATCADLGGGLRQCVPDSGSCACREGDGGATRTCLRAGAAGTCFGTETCDPATGWFGCDALEPSAEVCDGVDNDCNSAVDDVAGRGDSCVIANGFGTCPGARACTPGEPALVCVGQTPSAEVCNYLDDDCDGATDEGFSDLNQSCSEGVGACRRFGFNVCTADGTGTVCNAVAADPTAELCDNVDNDCDGLTDEHPDGLWDAKGAPCGDGQGVCAVLGVYVCSGDGQAIVCGATAPEPAVSDEVGLCNGLDDDCDGLTDEDFPGKGEVCSVGLGACRAFGNRVCAADGLALTCNAVAGAPVAEVCDLLDNDCDGATDNGFVDGDGKYFRDEACGNCFTDCTAIFARPNAYGVCDATGTPTCALSCCKVGDTDGGCTGAADHFNLNGVPDDGCEFTLDTDAIYVSRTSVGANDVLGCGLGPASTGEGRFPCRTIGFGIAEADRVGRSKVLVADGLYEESITLISGVSVLGGHRADTWERSVSGTNTTLRGPSGGMHTRTVIAEGVVGPEPTVLEGFLIYGANNFTPGGNSYAVWVRDSSSALEIRNNLIFGGFGGVGAAGAGGGPVADGGHGEDGQTSITTDEWEDGGCDALPTTPGNQGLPGDAGANTCGGAATNGGAGAGARCPDDNDKQPDGQLGTTVGDATGGARGVGGTDRFSNNCSLFTANGSATGLPGGDGGGGVDAPAGAGCADVLGQVVGGHWVGAPGADAPGGTPGAGGGGGGAGGGADVRLDCIDGARRNDTTGGSGGGGGAGGCGGLGGSGGQPGGGAFAVFVTFTAPAAVGELPVIVDNTVARGAGGDGGDGGAGSKGGLGGDGGDGGLATGSYAYAMGNGGRGGQGGDGGHGAGGGGGCGGVSFGIYLHNATSPPAWDAINLFAAGGLGGQGGEGGLSPGNLGEAGEDGVASDWSW